MNWRPFKEGGRKVQFSTFPIQANWKRGRKTGSMAMDGLLYCVLPICYQFWYARKYTFVQHSPGKQAIAPLVQLAEQVTLNHSGSDVKIIAPPKTLPIRATANKPHLTTDATLLRSSDDTCSAVCYGGFHQTAMTK